LLVNTARHYRRVIHVNRSGFAAIQGYLNRQMLLLVLPAALLLASLAVAVSQDCFILSISLLTAGAPIEIMLCCLLYTVTERSGGTPEVLAHSR
jgi:hypothetical protein